jgi:hypothetical protein
VGLDYYQLQHFEKLVLDSAMCSTEVTILSDACKNLPEHHERSVCFKPNLFVDSNPVFANPVISTVYSSANLLKAHTIIKILFLDSSRNSLRRNRILRESSLIMNHQAMDLRPTLIALLAKRLSIPRFPLGALSRVNAKDIHRVDLFQ